MTGFWGQTGGSKAMRVTFWHQGFSPTMMAEWLSRLSLVSILLNSKVLKLQIFMSLEFGPLVHFLGCNGLNMATHCDLRVRRQLQHPTDLWWSADELILLCWIQFLVMGLKLVQKQPVKYVHLNFISHDDHWWSLMINDDIQLKKTPQILNRKRLKNEEPLFLWIRSALLIFLGPSRNFT